MSRQTHVRGQYCVDAYLDKLPTEFGCNLPVLKFLNHLMKGFILKLKKKKEHLSDISNQKGEIIKNSPKMLMNISLMKLG